jgi:hypothetical protein
MVNTLTMTTLRTATTTTHIEHARPTLPGCKRTKINQPELV